jgi:hypothetical protein
MFNESLVGILESCNFYFFTDLKTKALDARTPNKCDRVLYAGRVEDLEGIVGFKLRIPEYKMLFFVCIRSKRTLCLIDHDFNVRSIANDDLLRLVGDVLIQDFLAGVFGALGDFNFDEAFVMEHYSFPAVVEESIPRGELKRIPKSWVMPWMMTCV